jgi:hypothetical protein
MIGIQYCYSFDNKIKSGRHDISELLLKVVLNTKIKSTKNKIEMIVSVSTIFLGIVLPMLYLDTSESLTQQ